MDYSEIPDEVRNAKSSDGNLIFCAANICVHYFSLDFLEEAIEKEDLLPVHLAKKKIPHVTEAGTLVNPEIPNGVKLEKFVFDAFQFVEADKFAVFECERDEEFAPLKSAMGNKGTPDHCLSKLSNLHAKWILDAGAKWGTVFFRVNCRGVGGEFEFGVSNTLLDSRSCPYITPIWRQFDVPVFCDTFCCSFGTSSGAPELLGS